MKIILSVLVALAVVLISCSPKKAPMENVGPAVFKYRDYFLLKSLNGTLADCKASVLINKSKDMSDSLIVKWLHPFSIEGGVKNKMLSYQRGGRDYHALLLLVVGDTFSDSSSYECYDTRQYLLATNDAGDFIDGMRVQSFESGLDTLIDGKKAVMVISTWSKFQGDTTRLFSKTTYLQETQRAADFLQEKFEELDETVYVFSLKGKINKVEFKKGELKKLSEGTVSRSSFPEDE